ncbi:MAG TPA: ABC transporter ATP-binding protein [Candidatus Omnitrophota bacterium]|nr:ABC transporter ATP-binding protein [Candidatus Omnitrophota bacterium]
MLEAKNIYKSYRQAGNILTVLKGVNIKVDRGEILCVVGPSGAGKSTLLHILGGLDDPDQGEVFLNNENIYAGSDEKRAKIRNQKIGFIFQFYHLLPDFTAIENVMLPAIIDGAQKNIKDIEVKSLEVLTEIGLKDRVKHKPSQLSGGEQQRVAIARALMNNPDVVLCDEPTGNLDSQNGDAIKDILVRLNEKNRQTLIIVSHDEGFKRIAHRTIYMRDGKIV